jgi:hypothetical protein
MTQEERIEYRQAQMRKGRDEALLQKGTPSVADRMIINHELHSTEGRKEDYRDAFKEYLRGGVQDRDAYKEELDALKEQQLKAGLDAWKNSAGKPLNERIRAAAGEGRTYADKLNELNEYYGNRADERAYDYGHSIGEADKEMLQGRENHRTEYFKNMYGDDFYKDGSKDSESGKDLEKGESDRRPGFERRPNPFQGHRDLKRNETIAAKDGASFRDAVRHGEDNIQRNVDSKGLHGVQVETVETDLEK